MRKAERREPPSPGQASSRGPSSVAAGGCGLHRLKTCGALAGILLLGANASLAEDAYAPPAVEIVVAPYLWAAGLDGNLAVRGRPPVSVSADFSDIWNALQFAFMGTAEIRYGEFGLFNDIFYVDLAGTQATPFGFLANSVHVDTSVFMFTSAAEYRLVDTPKGTLDLMAGLRIWSVDTSVTIAGGPLAGTRSGRETWTDPLVGAKGQIFLSPEIFLSGWGMVGGFGVSSDFMWDVNAGVGYQFNETASVTLGYRAMGVDYRSGGFSFDVTQHGPMTTFAFRF